MEYLPDEIWSSIFQIGVDKAILDVRDISSLSLTCKNFDSLCKDDNIWSSLLTLDLPSQYRRMCYALLKALCDKPAIKKNLYKFELKKRLTRLLTSAYSKIAADRQYLVPYAINVISAQSEIDNSTEEVLYALEKRLDDPSMGCHQELEQMILMNKQLREYSENLSDMINSGLHGAPNVGLTCQLPFAPAAHCSESTSASSSSTTPDCGFVNHVFEMLKTAAEKQELILNNLHHIREQTEILLRRQLDLEKHIERITSQISSLTYPYEDKYPLTAEDLDDTDNEDDAEEEDNGGDYDDMEAPDGEEF